MNTVAYVLIIIMSLPYGGNSLVHTQEFDSKVACTVAQQTVQENGKNVRAFCVPK